MAMSDDSGALREQARCSRCARWVTYRDSINVHLEKWALLLCPVCRESFMSWLRGMESWTVADD